MKRFGSRGGAHLDDLVERTLACARVAREPSVADKERVLSSLREYLDAGSLSDDSLQEDVVSGVREIVKEAARPRPRRLPRWARPWVAVPATVQALVAVSAFAGTVGFWLGSKPEPATPAATTAPIEAPAIPARAATRSLVTPLLITPPSVEPTAAAPVVPAPAKPEATTAPRAPAPAAPTTLPSPSRAPTPAAPAVTAHPPTPSEPARLAPSSARGPSAPEPAAAHPLPRAKRSLGAQLPGALPPGALPPAALLPGALPPAAPSPSPHATSAPAPQPPAPYTPATSAPPHLGDPRFLEAVRLVQRAQRSIENGAPSVALSLLDELDARFPAALLNEERLATRVLALCAGGAVARAQRVAAELAARSPSSIYAARIAQSCAGTGAPVAPRR